MGLAYDTSFPLPDLADQSGPGETSVGPRQSQNWAGTGVGKASLPHAGAHSSMLPRDWERWARGRGMLGGWRVEASGCQAVMV